MSTILCIDDEPSVGSLLENALTQLGHEPLLATSLEEGLEILARTPLDLVISDFRLPTGTGIDLLQRMGELSLDVPVIIMTGFSSVENAVQSMRHGAVDYLTKPLRNETLRVAVNKAIQLEHLKRENENFRRELNRLRGPRALVGNSPVMREVYGTIEKVAPTRASILLQGESGTGKELVALAIHDLSSRREQAMITVNCAALPEGLVESTLFGHERGAFTGATARAIGAFERAHRSTLLLDEISEMRLDLQAKLLRVIQEQEFDRVGGSNPVKVDVRIIATTNRNIADEVEASRFRRDLFYRLSVVPIRTPALRERLDDIPLLVAHFVDAAAAQLGIKPPEVPDETVEHLQRRPWPGNVRELANAVERAVILCRDGRLTPVSFEIPAGMLPSAPLSSAIAGGAGPLPSPLPGDELPINLHELERIAIERALIKTKGQRTKAAQLLGISERTLRNKLNVRPS